MALKNINPTKTNTWQKLTSHFEEIKDIHLKDFFRNDKNRTSNFSISLDDLKVDYSKNRITEKTLDLLIELANEVDLKNAIQKYFSGDIINTTENRAVLHTALRDTQDQQIFVDSVDIKPEIKNALQQVKEFSEKVISGSWKGFTGKRIAWGSSFSAALVFQLASKRGNDLAGILGFSPASGGPMAACKPSLYAKDVKIPALGLRPRREMRTGVIQFAEFKKHGIQTYVSENGVHGSSMLVKARVKGETKDHWKVVLAFIKKQVGS